MVLDASALLALVNAEPGWEAVAEALPDAVISAVNLSEAAGKLTDHGMPDPEIHSALTGLGLETVPFDDVAALEVGALRRVKGGDRLSLGDRACLQLACRRGEPAMTADRFWARLDVGVEVILLC